MNNSHWWYFHMWVVARRFHVLYDLRKWLLGFQFHNGIQIYIGPFQITPLLDFGDRCRAMGYEERPWPWR
jgi:hypothetical protein